MRRKFIAVFVVILLSAGSLYLLVAPRTFKKIDRVIISTNLNPMYYQFWPLVAKMWSHFGIKPTLALIAPEGTPIDTSIGEVYRFDPIPNLPTSTQAQAMRLLLPAYFEDEVCLISDIDMIPLNKQYFEESIKGLPDNAFVVYRDQAYGENFPQYPMCYLAAKGKTFKDLFNIDSIHNIPRILQDWIARGYGWQTDEKILYTTLNNWAEKEKRFIKLGHSGRPRVDRGDWQYDPLLVQKGHYIDSHLLRPYDQYKKEIDTLAALILNQPIS